MGQGAMTALAALVLLAAAPDNSGTPDEELMLGTLRTFVTRAEAEAACGPGAVVWAERYAGYYFKPDEPKFGVATPGAYACRAEAAAANYWDTDPMAGVMNYRGKSFPSGSWGS